MLRLFLLKDLNKREHIGVSFPCDLLQLVVPSLEVVVGPRAAHQESSPRCFNLPLILFFVQTPSLYELVQLVSTVSHCFSHVLL